jgi:large subunit ribosomal protein L29
MKIAEIIQKSDDQLKQLLIDLKKESFNLRFQKVSGQLANTSRMRIVRRLVAKVKTILTQRNSMGTGVNNA